MGLLAVFTRWFASPAPAPVRPVALAPTPAAEPALRLPPLRREEVVDRKGRLYGYRFGLAGGGSERLLFPVLAAERIAEFAARRMAVIPLSPAGARSLLHKQFAAAHTVFLLDAGELRDDGAELLRGLKENGARAGLRGLPDGQEAMLDACDVLFLDLGQVDLPHFHAMLDRVRAAYPALQIAVEGVSSWEEQRMCVEWGADYCLGSFLFQRDGADEDGSLDQSRLTALKMLNLLRADAELTQLAEAAKQDPAITFQLLKWANAPVNGQAAAVTGLNQAIMVLGRNVLYRWLAVSIFRIGRQRERDAAILEVALRRARFLELADPRRTAAERDELFLVGLLSLFDVLFGMPMARVLEHMALSQDIHDVLMRSGGRYGPYLMLALVVERGDLARAATMALAVGVDPQEIGAVQGAAFAWAQESMREQA